MEQHSRGQARLPDRCPQSHALFLLSAHWCPPELAGFQPPPCPTCPALHRVPAPLALRLLSRPPAGSTGGLAAGKGRVSHVTLISLLPCSRRCCTAHWPSASGGRGPGCRGPGWLPRGEGACLAFSSFGRPPALLGSWAFPPFEASRAFKSPSRPLRLSPLPPPHTSSFHSHLPPASSEDLVVVAGPQVILDLLLCHHPWPDHICKVPVAPKVPNSQAPRTQMWAAGSFAEFAALPVCSGDSSGPHPH